MRTALIGYTGFVGGNIKSQHEFDDYYNSKNIADIEGQEYDLVVSAANHAKMWQINPYDLQALFSQTLRI